MNEQELSYEKLWQHYSQESQGSQKVHLMPLLPNAKSYVAAQKAVADGQNMESILQMLQFDPEFQRVKEEWGEDHALYCAELAFQYAYWRHADLRHNPGNPVWNFLRNLFRMNGLSGQNSFREQYTSRQGLSASKPKIVDLGMLDTEYAQMVEDENIPPVHPSINLRNLMFLGFYDLCLLSTLMLLLSVCFSCWISYTGGAGICNKPQPYLVDICQLSKAKNGH